MRSHYVCARLCNRFILSHPQGCSRAPFPVDVPSIGAAAAALMGMVIINVQLHNYCSLQNFSVEYFHMKITLYRVANKTFNF